MKLPSALDKDKSNDKTAEVAEDNAPVSAGQEPETSGAEPANSEIPEPVARPAKTVGALSPAIAAAKLRSAEKEAHAAVKAQQHRFMSPYPRLTIYVDIGRRETENGNTRTSPVPIVFKNGTFLTSDARVAAAIRKHKKCNTNLFREVNDVTAAARMMAAQQAETLLRNSVQQGPTGAGDGSEHEFLQKQSILQQQQAAAWSS